MKQNIICVIILIISAHSFGQQATAITPVLTKTDYLQKSKHQKTAAWVLLGGGGGLFITGIAIPRGGKTDFNILSLDYNHKNDGIKGVLELSGTLSMLGSIPLFIAAGKNRRKAMSATASFKMENAPIIQHSSFVQTSFPAVSVKINL